MIKYWDGIFSFLRTVLIKILDSKHRNELCKFPREQKGRHNGI